MNVQAIPAITDSPRYSLLGLSALIFEAPGEFDLDHQRRIWAMADIVASWPQVREAVPGMTNLTVLFRQPPEDPWALGGRLVELWQSGVSKDMDGRTLDIPIVYGGEGGPHLAEVAEMTGLSIEAVVAIHSAPLYPVYAVGSHAGYCYLGGLDQRLFLPPRAVPLLSIPGGSLSIAGRQTGVSASAGPSGWHTIGSANAVFFDPHRSPPALLAPGDAIRFHPEKILP
jgi:KipI family sensor histidine kinase inhibitor